MLHAHDTLDGYTLRRRIGVGGFGEVWLATAAALGQAVALKAVEAPRSVQRELAAVRRFKALGARHAGLVSIEHVGLLPAGGFFYVMPLADGPDRIEAQALEWRPHTLSSRIQDRRAQSGAWFTAKEIRAWIAGIGRGAAALEEAGLVHRDIKPDNILFVRGQAVLSDISLLAEERMDLTEMGTPGYQAPSWFTETGGNPDAYGLAATLFTALTGHAPDKLGRVAYRWPLGGETSLSPEEREEWLRLHRVIFRATHEKSSERFRTLAELAAAIEGGDSASARPATWRALPLTRRHVLIGGAALAGLATLAWFTRGLRSPGQALQPESPAQAPAAPKPDGAAAQAQAPDNPWGEFDQLIVQSGKETAAIESEWMALKENTRGRLLALREVKRLDEVDVIVDQLSANFTRLDDIEFDRLDALRKRWIEKQLPVAWRKGLEADKQADGWKAAERRKQQMADLDAIFTRLKKDEVPLSASWKVSVTRYLEALQAMSQDAAFQERVLAMLEKVSPEHKIQKRIREAARNREADATAASPNPGVPATKPTTP